jgi:sulfoxide reductase catalytic subunit YedY
MNPGADSILYTTELFVKILLLSLSIFSHNGKDGGNILLIKLPKKHVIPECLVTPESVYMNRRKFLKSMGIMGIGGWSLLSGCFGNSSEAGEQLTNVSETIPKAGGIYPVQRNLQYKLDRPVTNEIVAASYNNYYEFTTDKDRVWRLAHQFETRPWQIEVTGEVETPQKYDIDELIKKMPLEERVYRFRCVEAWSMVVPWTGFPLSALIKEVQPTAKAKYVRLVSFHRPERAAGQKNQPWYPWPYYEGLTMEEAMNELTLMVTGIYGHELPKQHGAPLRLATPWKYGFKSIKGIVKIEFTSEQPKTFWNDLAPDEYGFAANVDPKVPHPRWSQATERVIDTGERIPTLPYNGYGEYVANLYG